MVSKFERVGINLQTNSETINEAIKNFQISCKICCSSGMYISCDRCSISVTHETTVAALQDIELFRKEKVEDHDSNCFGLQKLKPCCKFSCSDIDE